MRKTSKESESQTRTVLESLVDARDAIAMEVSLEVFEPIPYEQEFTLSAGSVG
jgi:hypothetical protein